MKTIKLHFDNERLDLDKTLSECGLEDGDQLEVSVNQLGGWCC